VRAGKLLTEADARALETQQTTAAQAQKAAQQQAQVKELADEVARRLQAQAKDAAAAPAPPPPPAARFARYKMFRSSLAPWETTFQRVTEFATLLGPGRVISISHSEDQNEAVVTVWYWDEAYEVQSSGPEPEAPKPKQE
jgi:hypothetical protein